MSPRHRPTPALAARPFLPWATLPIPLRATLVATLLASALPATARATTPQAAEAPQPAAEAEAPTDPATPAWTHRPSQTQIDTWHHLTPQATARSQHQLRLSQRHQGQHTSGLQWVAEWRLDADTQGQAHGTQAGPTRRPTPPALWLGEAYLRQQGDDWQLSLGRQRVEWATTDTVSPSDLINPRDWTDLSRVDKRPLPALRLTLGDDDRLDLVLTPGGQALLPQGAWASPLPPGVALAPAQAAGPQRALRYTTHAANTDWSLVAYHGPAHTPSAQWAAAAPQPTLQPFYDTTRVLALGLTRPVAEGSLLRLEWAHTRQRVGDHFHTLVASVDHEWALGPHGRDQLYALLQTQHEHITRAGQQVPGWWDFRRVFNHHLMLRLAYQPGQPQAWRWALEGTLQPRTRQTYLRLSTHRTLSPHLTLELGAIALSGPPGSFWGSHTPARQAFAHLTWRL